MVHEIENVAVNQIFKTCNGLMMKYTLVIKTHLKSKNPPVISGKWLLSMKRDHQKAIALRLLKRLKPSKLSCFFGVGVVCKSSILCLVSKTSKQPDGYWIHFR